MLNKVLLGIFLIILLSGCATPRAGQDIQMQQLQGRIRYLEVELQKKDREIERLEEELERVQEVALSTEGKKEEETEISPQRTTRNIQIALKNAGFYKGSIDGEFGPQTKEAIKVFQKANGLKVDGVVGKVTWAKLKKYLD